MSTSVPVHSKETTLDQTIDRTIAALERVQTYEGVTLSPDGSRVAFVRNGASTADRRSSPTGLFVLPVRGGVETRVSAVEGGAGKRRKGAPGGAHESEETSAAWSPDGSELLFISDARGGRQQLYVASADGSRVRAITNVAGSFASPRFSRDGRKIAVLLIENASRKGGALAAMTPPSGDVEKQVEEQRIVVIDRASGQLTFASPADMYVYDYDWSPDGKFLVAEAAFGSGDDNYWVAQLFRFEIGTPGAKVIYKPSLQLASPRWSPDGNSIAFIEGLMSDEGSTGGDVMVIPSAGGPPRNVTPGLPASVTTFEWLPGAREILAAENINGLSGFARIDTHDGQIRQLWSGEEKVSNGSLIAAALSRDGSTSAVIRESFTRPPEIWVGAVGDWRQRTHANDGIQPICSKAENLNWTSDGLRVQGWLLFPLNSDPAKRNPMVVQVHGGPSSGATSSWLSLNTAALVASGYAVLLPNPRGSFGQGEAFTQANVKDFGYGDFRDIVAGVDAAVAHASIDRERVGIWGWSYGGYMTMWAVTQTTRFRAAVAGAGIVNWESYYGQNSIDQWMVPFFGATVYDDPWIYRRSSPIEFIKQVKTPTLVLVGDRDGEVPSPQSFEFWHALKARGVKTQLIVYPNEGHRFVDPLHNRDRARRIVMWFNENM